MTNTTNQIALDAPKYMISLASSACYVLIETHIYTGVTQNRKESAKVTAAANAASNAAKVQQYLFANVPEHKNIVDYRARIYNWSQREGWDGAGGAIRIIPMIEWDRFLKEYEAHRVEFYRLVGEFLAVYSMRVTAAAMTQGALFDASLYPKPEVLAKKFSCELIPMDVPRGDFVNQLFEESAADLKAHYERKASELIANIAQESAARLIEVAEQISAACTEVDKSAPLPEGEKKPRAKKIYEVTVNKAKGIGKTLRCMNITGDQTLADAIDKFDAVMSKVSFNDLRESAYERSIVKAEVDDLLTAFKPLRGGY